MIDQPKCVLVGVTAHEQFAATPALSFAIDLAKRHEACLTVCALAPALYLPVTRTGGAASAMLREEIEHYEEMCRLTARAAADLVGRAGVSCISEQTLTPLESRTGRFVRLARVNDVSVLDAPTADDDTLREVVEDTLFESGRPAIVVPNSGAEAAPDNIAIAWDGSARSARAVADAFAFLRTAKKIFIVTVTGEKDLSRMAPGADLATYLLRHGVQEPQLEMLSAKDGDVAGRLRKFVKDEAIDMVVMGAFVHSRFRQAILGGVTSSLLDDAPTTLFMAY